MKGLGPDARFPWIYRALLALAPAEFRAGYGVDLLETVAARRRATTAGPVWFWIRESKALFREVWRFRLWDTGRRVRRREMSVRSRVSDVGRDVWYALRGLGRRPGFAFVTIATLTIGLGANAAIFSVVHAVLLQPLPYEDGDRIVVVQDEARLWGLTEVEFLALAERTGELDGLTATGAGEANVSGDGLAVRVPVAWVSWEFFDVFRTGMDVGRGFVLAEDDPNADRVVVLTHGFWSRRFGGDSSVVGTPVMVNDVPRVVVGILPATFRYPGDVAPDMLLPLMIARTAPNPKDRYIVAFGRVSRDVALADAQRALSTFVAERIPEWEARWPNLNTTRAVFLWSLRGYLVGDVAAQLWLVFGAVGFVMLIAGVNVASLALGRAEDRAREVAIRFALGGSRGRVMSAMLLESMIIGVTGAVIALASAPWTVAAIVRFAPASTSLFDRVHVDGNTVLFTITLGAVVGFAFGLVPALRMTHGQRTRLREGGQSSGNVGARLLRAGLVVTEVALAMALVAGTGLVVKSLVRIHAVDLGVDASGVYTFRVQPTTASYPEITDFLGVYDRVARELADMAGVTAVGATTHLPLDGTNSNSSLQIANRIDDDDETIGADYRIVTPEFFAAVRLAVVSGRPFERSDRDGAPPVALLNQAAVRRYWPDEPDVVGERIRLTDAGEWMTVVGIVRDVQSASIGAPVRPRLYLPRDQTHYTGYIGTWRRMTLAVRGSDTSAGMARLIRAAVARVDPNLPISRLRPMDDVVSQATAERRFLTAVLALFSAVALVLAPIGVYGVMAFLVSRRTRELAVRLALGARATQVRRQVLSESGRLVLLGVGLGTVGSVALGRVMQGFLYEVSPGDPGATLMVALLLTTVGLAASYFPARRATRIDPVEALRQE